MNISQFPAVLPVLPRLPSAFHWTIVALRLDDPRRQLHQIIYRALTVYESCHREYTAYCRTYHQRRGEVQQHADRQAQPGPARPRNRGANARGSSPDELVGPALELGSILASAQACQRRAQRAFERVSAAYSALELLNAKGGGGGSKAMTELRACLAAESPIKRARTGVAGLLESPGSHDSAAVEPQHREDSPGERPVTSAGSPSRELNANKPGADEPTRNGHRR